jgi:DNA-binding transcriptional regulator YdaS (Cro superfamily)
MALPPTNQDRCEHFAHCVQVLGGITASSRRLGIDERAIRRFINGERQISAGLLQDTATALRLLIDEATEAERWISSNSGSEGSAGARPPSG